MASFVEQFPDLEMGYADDFPSDFIVAPVLDVCRVAISKKKVRAWLYKHFSEDLVNAYKGEIGL